MFGFIKGQELLIIFAVLLLLFGTTRLPQLGKSMGSAIRNFKKGISTDDKEDEQADTPPANNKATAHKNLESASSQSTSEVSRSEVASKN